MSQRCGHCKVSVIAVQSESRSLALMRFSQLQRQGHLPTMCESANGQFTVCYDAAERRLTTSSTSRDRPWWSRMRSSALRAWRWRSLSNFFQRSKLRASARRPAG
jgi:hypothetical protein